MDKLFKSVLEIDPSFRYASQEDRIKTSKTYSKIRKSVKSKQNNHHCLLCNKECGFCSSHTIPRLFLNNIAQNGKVGYINTIGGLEVLKDLKGINEAGVFHLICCECDGKMFQEYEKEYSYTQKPSQLMLSQIALKNCLRMVDKRTFENPFWQELSDDFGFPDDISHLKQTVGSIDLNEYKDELEFAHRSILKPKEDSYYLNTYIVLPYKVPLAFQGLVTLITDLNDAIINNIYNYDPKYILKSLHIAVFPLETKSIILLFVQKNNKRYRSFFKEFNKLNLNDQLAIINFLIFAYSEDYFLSPQLSKSILDSLRPVMQLNTELLSLVDSKNKAMEYLKEQYSFKHSIDIPNLLSEKYQI